MANSKIALTWAEVIAEGFRAVTPWPLMADDDKATWAKHAKKYLGKVTADDVTMTWDRFGQVVHTTGKALESQWRRSEAGSISSDLSPARTTGQRRSDAKRFFDHATPDEVTELLKEVMEDEDVAESVTTTVAANPKATAQVASKVESRRSPAGSSAGSGGGLGATASRIHLISAYEQAVLVIDGNTADITAKIRDSVITDEVARNWHNKLDVAVQMLGDAVMEGAHA